MTTDEIIHYDQANIWHPFTPLISDFDYIPLKSAKGAKLTTTEGQEIIDAVSSWWVNIHGHGNEKIAEAIYHQAKEMEHVIFAGFTHEPAVQLSKNLMSILPDDYSKVFFSDNGSTSVEVALKMAMQFWFNQGEKNKNRIIAFKGSYHGDTFGSMSVGSRSVFFAPFESMLFDVDFIDIPTNENFDQVLEEFERLAAKDNCAAFIFEPLVQGAGGMRMYDPAHLDTMLSFAKDQNIVTIADEVMTGWGRTGTRFACDQLENKPDIMCVSKGITGGTMPLGITACHQRIEEAFRSADLSKALLHGHSYTGNPLACAAANASFKIFESETCKNNIMRVANRQESFAISIKALDNVENVRTTGTIMAFDLKGFGDTGYDSGARKKIYPFFLERGVLIRPLGNVIYVMPPYVISDEELDIVYDQIRAFLVS